MSNPLQKIGDKNDTIQYLKASGQISTFVEQNQGRAIVVYGIDMLSDSLEEGCHWQYIKSFCNGLNVLDFITLPGIVFHHTTFSNVVSGAPQAFVPLRRGRVMILSLAEENLLPLRQHLEGITVCVRPYHGMQVPYTMTTVSPSGKRVDYKAKKVADRFVKQMYKSGMVLPVRLEPVALLVDGGFRSLQRRIDPIIPALSHIDIPFGAAPEQGVDLSTEAYRASIRRASPNMLAATIDQSVQAYRQFVQEVHNFGHEDHDQNGDAVQGEGHGDAVQGEGHGDAVQGEGHEDAVHGGGADV